VPNFRDFLADSAACRGAHARPYFSGPERPGSDPGSGLQFAVGGRGRCLDRMAGLRVRSRGLTDNNVCGRRLCLLGRGSKLRANQRSIGRRGGGSVERWIAPLIWARSVRGGAAGGWMRPGAARQTKWSAAGIVVGLVSTAPCWVQAHGRRRDSLYFGAADRCSAWNYRVLGGSERGQRSTAN